MPSHLSFAALEGPRILPVESSAPGRRAERSTAARGRGELGGSVAGGSWAGWCWSTPPRPPSRLKYESENSLGGASLRSNGGGTAVVLRTSCGRRRRSEGGDWPVPLPLASSSAERRRAAPSGSNRRVREISYVRVHAEDNAPDSPLPGWGRRRRREWLLLTPSVVPGCSMETIASASSLTVCLDRCRLARTSPEAIGLL